MLVAELGWHMPASPGGLVAGIPAGVLRRLEHQAGLPAGRLDSAVLDRYLPAGAARRRGSRYCPSCLAELGGRWLLAWRLGWMFACTAHGVLLCDACPACGQEPRSRTGRTSGLNPPGTSPTPSSGTTAAARTCARLLRGGSTQIIRCWPPSAGPGPCSPSMTPSPRETAAHPATWASSHPGCCARHRRPASPAPARWRWPPGANRTSSHLPGASRAGSRPPAPRRPAPWPPLR